MRHRRHTVNAARYAELQALRTKGYRVLCVSEYMWPGDSEKRTDVILDQFAHLASGKREVEWKRVVEDNTPVAKNDVLNHVSDSS